MKCTRNKPLTDVEIDTVLDGVAKPETRQHLRECEYCANEVRRAAQFEAQMKTALHRGDCPSSLELAEYHTNMLEDSDMIASIQHHLTTCSRCQNELAMLDQFLDIADTYSGEPNPELLNDEILPISSDISRLSINFDEPDRVLRGKKKGPIMASAADGTTLFIEVETELDVHTLTAQIVVEDTDPWDHAQVQVFQPDMLVAITLVEELGDFTCYLRDNTTPITIRINNKQGKTIVLQDIALSE